MFNDAKIPANSSVSSDAILGNDPLCSFQMHKGLIYKRGRSVCSPFWKTLTENIARSYFSKQESAKMNSGGDSVEGSLCEYDCAELTSLLKPNITSYILNPTTCLGQSSLNNTGSATDIIVNGHHCCLLLRKDRYIFQKESRSVASCVFNQKPTTRWSSGRQTALLPFLLSAVY